MQPLHQYSQLQNSLFLLSLGRTEVCCLQYMKSQSWEIPTYRSKGRIVLEISSDRYLHKFLSVRDISKFLPFVMKCREADEKLLKASILCLQMTTYWLFITHLFLSNNWPNTLRHILMYEMLDQAQFRLSICTNKCGAWACIVWQDLQSMKMCNNL